MFYKTTGTKETKVDHKYPGNSIFGITVKGNPIGSNLTVQVAALHGKSFKEGARSNPVTTGTVEKYTGATIHVLHKVINMCHT